MKKLFLFFGIFSLTSCLQPLYESDYPVYQQYKYWESGKNDWVDIDQFKVQTFKTPVGEKTALRLIPQQDGLPSSNDGYLRAAQKAAFSIMSEICAEGFINLDSAAAPKNGRTLDRFFYQYPDASVGVTFSCRYKKPTTLNLLAEQKKWSLAQREWKKINDTQAFVDILPPSGNGRQQIRVRLLGGTISDNKKLARQVIQDICPTSNFRILSDREGFEISPNGKVPEIVSDKNVRIYDFNCHP